MESIIQLPTIDFSKFKNKDCNITSIYSELPNFVTTLISPINGSKIYLIGTSHVSQNSVQEVREIIRFLRPNTILIELCSNRLSLLKEDEGNETANNNSLNKSSKNDECILHSLISSFYGRVQEQLKIKPGSEFRVAFEEGKRLGSRRTWSALSLKEKIIFIFYLLNDLNFTITAEDVEKLKNSDLITELMKEATNLFPSLLKPILHERDQFLATSLKLCQGPVVVGVVGLGHIQGIKDNWNTNIEIKKLMEIPVQPAWHKYILIGIFIAIPFLLAFIFYYFYKYSPIPISLILFFILWIYLLYREFFKMTTSEMLEILENKIKKNS